MLTWLVSGVTVRADSGYDAPQARKTRGYRCWGIPKAKYRRMSHPGSCRSRWISCQLGLRPSIIWSRKGIFCLLPGKSTPGQKSPRPKDPGEKVPPVKQAATYSIAAVAGNWTILVVVVMVYKQWRAETPWQSGVRLRWILRYSATCRLSAERKTHQTRGKESQHYGNITLQCSTENSKHRKTLKAQDNMYTGKQTNSI